MTTPTSNALSYRQHARALASLGLPLIGGHLAQYSIGLVDTVFLGWYSVDALAAVTIASALFMILFFLGAGFSSAVMPLVAAFDEEGKKDKVRGATRMGLYLSVFFALGVTPIFWWSKPFLELLGQNEKVAQAGQDYLRIAGWGLIPALAAAVLRSYVAALQRSQVVLWMSVLAALTNGIGNYIFIFGNLGAPEWGLQGAAFASLATNLIAMGGLLYMALSLFPEHTLIKRWRELDRDMLGAVFRLGWPIGLSNFSEGGLFVASALMMGWLGTIPLAAHGVVITLATATFMIHMGIGNAGTIRAGSAYGQRDPDHLARGGKVVFLWSSVVSAIAIASFLLIPEPLVGLFVDTADPDREAIIAVGVELLAAATLFQWMDGTQVVAQALLRGVLDTKIPLFVAAFSYWAVGIPCSYYFGFVLEGGGVGVWLGLVVGLTLAALLLTVRFWGPAMKKLRDLSR